METIVHITHGGHAFHESRNCRALRSGQDMWDSDDWCGYAILPTTIPEAMDLGKLPCLVCLPDYTPAWFRSPSEDDFGHEPVEHQGDLICPRCRTHHVDEDGERYSIPAFWPCTSARVLGLAPRWGVTAS